MVSNEYKQAEFNLTSYRAVPFLNHLYALEFNWKKTNREMCQQALREGKYYVT